MPYRKIAKDIDGARAEVVAADIAQIVQIGHPSLDLTRISVETNEENQPIAVLPNYIMNRTLSDMIFNHVTGLGPIDNELTVLFLQSFGSSLALKWFCGEGDVNPTNFSVVNGRCYPFDFDCCFESIQSENSFAKKRIPTFQSIDINQQHGAEAIIRSSITNICQSIHSVMGDAEAGLDDLIAKLTEAGNIRCIQEGFHEQLERMVANNFQGIIHKHIPVEGGREQYENFLREKQREAQQMIATSAEEKKGGICTWASFFARCFGVDHRHNPSAPDRRHNPSAPDRHH